MDTLFFYFGFYLSYSKKSSKKKQNLFDNGLMIYHVSPDFPLQLLVELKDNILLKYDIFKFQSRAIS